MRSCFYEGHVVHRRFDPVEHSFRYRLFMVYADLAEIDDVFGRRGFWSTHWPAIARFRRADYLGDPSRPLYDCVTDLVLEHTGKRPAGPIRLLTNFRYFGFRMNPVSFYYCFDATGEEVETVVAEVSNTPWNERHCYVLNLAEPATDAAMTMSLSEYREVEGPAEPQYGNSSMFLPAQQEPRPPLKNSKRTIRYENSKEFHVSPFMPMSMTYHWQLSSPGERLSIVIENSVIEEHPQGQNLIVSKHFDAVLSMTQREMSRWQRTRMLLLYPAMTLQVFLAIYWQAFRLWLKHVPYVPHPRKISSASLHIPRLSTTENSSS